MEKGCCKRKVSQTSVLQQPFSPGLFHQVSLLSLSHQEIQNIHSAVRLSPVQLCVSAAAAADRNKFLILNIKNLCEISACGLKLIAHILTAPALGTSVLHFLHIHPPFQSACLTVSSADQLCLFLLCAAFRAGIKHGH